LIAAGAVVATSLAASIAGHANGFVSDDVPLIQNNARIHDLAQWREILAAPYWPPPFSQDLFRPAASVLAALQHAAGAGAPTIFRAISYALYAMACVAVFGLALRLVRSEIALGVALLFAADPLHVEAVALGMAQGEIIVGGIAAVMVTLYLDWRRRGNLRSRDWIVLAALYAFAALTKENGLVLPGLLLAAEMFLVGDGARKSEWAKLVGGYSILAGVALTVIVVRTLVLQGNVVGSFTADALVGLGVGGRALTMLRIVPEWERLLIWPVHLRLDYSPGEFVASRTFGAYEALGLVMLCAGMLTVWLARKRAPVASFGLVWCAIALLPVSNVLVPTGVLIAERTLFLPSIGAVLTVAAFAEYVISRWPASIVLKRSLMAACSVLVVASAVRSVRRQRVWHDARSLSIAGMSDAPRSWRVQRAYGEAMFDVGQTDEALAAYQRAIRLAPEPWFVRNDLSRRLRQYGADAEALDQLRTSLSEQPGQRGATVDLVVTLLALGKYVEAERITDSVIAIASAPRIMVLLRHVSDSAQKVHAPPGTVRLRMQAR
jgi:hypothetical protein